MKKYVFRIFILCIIIILVIGKSSFAGTAWESTDYTEIDSSNAIQKLKDLADAVVENKAGAEKWLKAYKQVQEAGKADFGDENYWFNFVNGMLGTSLNDSFADLKEGAENLIQGSSSGSTSEETRYKDKWSNWWSVPLSEYRNVSTAEDALILYNFIKQTPLNIEDMQKDMLQDYIRKMEALRNSSGLRLLDQQSKDGYTYSHGLDSIYRYINGNETLMERIAGTDEKGIIENSEAAKTSAGGNNTDDTIYTSQPKKVGAEDSANSLDDMISDANKFMNEGKLTYEEKNLTNVSNTIYNILLSVGICIAVLVGAIIGIKLMASGIDQKAEAKKLLIPYVVGCVIIFGGFGIWRILVSIIQGI